jgi:hypothetical protein
MDVTSEGWRNGGAPRGAGEALISVSPVAGGWCVSSPIEESLMFLTGDHAEHQARALGRCLASLGRTAVVEVRNRDGAVAGSVTYPAGGRGGAS